MKRQIDVVIPTYNRLWALRRVAGYYLQREEVLRLIVVDDGSTDGTENWLRKEAERNTRLIPIYHKENRGASASRNTGANAARAPFVFFADDDMLLSPADGLSLMVREMEVQSADIAAPIHILPESLISADLPTVDSDVHRPNVLLYHRKTIELRSRRKLSVFAFPASFPTPLACGLMLMRREVLEHILYDEELGATSYRDETDFQLKALRKGFRLIACARPVLIDIARDIDSGGCHTLTYTAYEWKACLNNWRILVRHRDVIHKRLGIRAPILYLQCCFVVEHAVNRLARYYLGRFLRSCGIMRRGE